MKQKLFLLMLVVFALGLQTPAMAQNRARRAENVGNAKLNSEQRINRQTDYVISQMMLDDSKKAEFTTIYKKYLTELKECQKEFREDMRENKVGKKELTDTEIQERLDGRFAQSQKILDIRKKYYNEFKKILTPQEIQKMYKAEKGIKNKVRKEIGRRKDIRRNNR